VGRWWVYDAREGAESAAEGEWMAEGEFVWGFEKVD